MGTRSPSNKGQSTARESTLRDRQTAAFDGRSTNVQPAAINTQDNTRGIIPGLTAGMTYGEGQDIKTQVEEGGGLPSTARETTLRASQAEFLNNSIDRPTERQQESIMTGAQTIQPGNYTVSNAQKFPIARPGTEYKNSDMVSAWVGSGFNDDILNILIRTT